MSTINTSKDPGLYPRIPINLVFVGYGLKECRIRLDQIQKISGHRDLNFEVNHIILAAKKTIYKCRLKGNIPCCNMSKREVKQFLNCFRYNLKTLQNREKLSEFDNRWDNTWKSISNPQC